MYFLYKPQIWHLILMEESKWHLSEISSSGFFRDRRSRIWVRRLAKRGIEARNERSSVPSNGRIIQIYKKTRIEERGIQNSSTEFFGRFIRSLEISYQKFSYETEKMQIKIPLPRLLETLA